MIAPKSSALAKNSLAYELGLREVEKLEHSPEACCREISRLVQLTTSFHSGRFADGALENILYRFGQELARKERTSVRELYAREKGGTLHVASHLYEVGGHSRVISDWMARDKSTKHSLAILWGEGIPRFLEEKMRAHADNVFCPPTSMDTLSRAAWLRKISRGFDRVILHHHPQDVVPSVAYAATDLPPVAMFNHAHFAFSLGFTVSDLVINTMDYFKHLSETRRFAPNCMLLPILSGLVPLDREPVDKEAAKLALGLSPEDKVVMSICGESYIQPTKDIDFLGTVGQLLSRNPSVHFFAVGISANCRSIPASLKENPRCHFPGKVPAPFGYYRAADVCLESAPKPSLGGFLESVAYGEAMPVPYFSPAESILRPPYTPFVSLPRTSDEASYLTYVENLLRHGGETRRKAQGLRDSVVTLDRELPNLLQSINSALDGLVHQPREIPTSGCLDSIDDVQRAEYAQGRDVSESFPFFKAIQLELSAVIRGHDRAARTAVRIARRGLRKLRA